jgi:hypothetical protein
VAAFPARSVVDPETELAEADRLAWLINGDDSLGPLFFLIPSMIMFCLGMTCRIFTIPFWVNDLFSGASSAGGEFGSQVSGAIRGAFM